MFRPIQRPSSGSVCKLRDMEVGGHMLRSHNLALCGWVNMKLYKLDMYIENDMHIKYKTQNIKIKITASTNFAIFILSFILFLSLYSRFFTLCACHFLCPYLVYIVSYLPIHIRPDYEISASGPHLHISQLAY